MVPESGQQTASLVHGDLDAWRANLSRSFTLESTARLRRRRKLSRSRCFM